MSEYPSYIIHYGVPNQKWGVRRYQNEDGSLTPEGREHYGYGSERDNRKLLKQVSKYGKNAKVTKSGSVYNIDRKAFGKHGYIKNKAIRQAVQDKKLNAAYEKAMRTPSKYSKYEPEFDITLDDMVRKSKKDWNNATKEEWETFLQKVNKEHDRRIKEYNKLVKKDPQTIAFKEYHKELERVATQLAGQHANDKIGEGTYSKHLEGAIGRIIVFKGKYKIKDI